MKKFILVDPSFDGVTGDKWQYAVAFARSARINGYEFILLSARHSPKLPLIDGHAIDQRPIFRFAFYEHDKIVARHHWTPAEVASRKRKYTDAALLQRLRDEDLRRAEEAHDPGLRAHAQRRIAAAERAAAHRAAATEAARAADPDVVEPFNRDDFGEALARELARINPQRGDVLFFHTMTPAMMESFSEAALHLPGPDIYDVDAYCLFHFGAEAPDARTFLDRYHSYGHVGSLKQRLAVGSPFRRLHLLATSQVLADECTRDFGMPVGVFHGLSNLGEHQRACGGADAARAIVVDKARALAEQGLVRMAIRAGDIGEPVVAALRQALHRLRAYGFTPQLRVLYHEKSLPRLREVLDWFGDEAVELVDVNDNDDYIVELARANLVLLTYIRNRYAKRVSAVLHDCSVLGTSCIVPAGTTLADAQGYADIYVYGEESGLAATVLQAARALKFLPQAVRDAKVEAARVIYGQDVVTAIMGSTTSPSLVVRQRGPIAAFFMPAWGRCGSSYAMEAQMRFLLSRGYFVVQVLVMDKPVDRFAALSYFWRLLLENSRAMRGSVMRIAYATFADHDRLLADPAYAGASAFDQYLQRIGNGDVRDAATVRALARAEVAIVNHVFNSRLAHKYIQCPAVLETHDIQSYQMQSWPLRNEIDGEVAPVADLLQEEMAEIGRFAHVVNVAPDEHRILSLANPRSTLVTPYVVLQQDPADPAEPKRIADLADAWGLSHYYRDVSRFQLLLLGDSHKANRESAEWFIEKVYLPFLQPQGRSLAVAGRISDVLYAKYGTIPNVFYIGFVPSVGVLRRLCDVSVLPDVRGTGISIKSLETFASGQAFVATNRALRGFTGLLPPGLLGFDSAEAFARRTEALLIDEEERRRCEALALEAYRVLASSERFDRAWETILDEVEGRRVQPVPVAVPA